jgi:hypothetical protein
LDAIGVSRSLFNDAALTEKFYRVKVNIRSRVLIEKLIVSQLAIKFVIFGTRIFITIFTRVAQLVEALHYKPEGRSFDSRWCHWNFSLT